MTIPTASQLGTLHTALDYVGLTSTADERAPPGKRAIHAHGLLLGFFDAHEAWGLVRVRLEEMAEDAVEARLLAAQSSKGR